jgi:ketosteroid isomerase-like protein
MKKSAIVAGMICFVISVSVAAPGVQGTAGQQERVKALASLVEAERAFSRTSDEKGIRDAFLAWLAPDAIVFRPMPVEGRPVYESMDPASPAHLIWEPEVAEIAASGEMGYTSGPYRLSPKRGAEPTGFGHYVSVWKKQPDGTWRVFLDIGVQHDPPASSAPVTNVATPRPEREFEALSLEAHRDEGAVVAKGMAEFDQAVGQRGYRQALAKFATSDVRLYRPGKFSVTGKDRIKDLIPISAGRIDPPRGPASPDARQAYQGRFEVHVAWSGDLAVTFGRTEQAKTRSAAETASFLKIWRKDAAGTWRICLDIEIPVPPEKEKSG